MLIIPGLSALCLSICIIGYNTNDDWSIGFYTKIYNDCGGAPTLYSTIKPVYPVTQSIFVMTY